MPITISWFIWGSLMTSWYSSK